MIPLMHSVWTAMCNMLSRALVPITGLASVQTLMRAVPFLRGSMQDAISFSALCPTCKNEVSKAREIQVRSDDYSERIA